MSAAPPQPDRPRPATPIADWQRLASTHYENFPVGSWLLPKAVRRHLHRIYAFARIADDLADEHRDAVALAAFRADFARHLAGDRDIPLFTELCGSIHERALPPRLFHDLLDAFEQDLTVRRYDEAGLFHYCKRSADPVGRLVLRVCGYDDPQLDAWSDAVCTGLQLLNHLQDIGADLRDRDRIYFPAADLARFGVGEEMLRAPVATANVRTLVAHWRARTAELLARGWPLANAVRGRVRYELRAILGGAAGVLRRIAAVDHDVLAHRVRLSKGAHVSILLRALLTSRPPKELR